MTSNVRIEITATDGTKQVFETVEGRLNRLSDEGKNTVGAFDDIGQGAARMSTAISHVIGISNSFEIRQLRLKDALEDLRRAQEAETAATIEHGPASEQAANAAHQRAEAEDRLEKIQRSGAIATAASVAQMVSLVAQAPAAITALRGLASSAAAAAAGVSALTIAATGGLAVIGIVGGWVLYETALKNTGDQAERARTRIQQLEAELQRAQNAQLSLYGLPPIDIPFLNRPAADVQRDLDAEKATEQERTRLAAQAEGDRRSAFVDSVAFRDSVRAASLAKDQAFFEQELAIVQESIRAKESLLSQTFTNVEEREKEMDALAALEARERVLQRGLTDLQSDEIKTRIEGYRAEEEARRAWADSFQGIAQQLSSGLASTNLNLGQLNIESLEKMVASGGYLGLLAEQARAAALAEANVTRAALEAEPALLAQLQVTKRKGETTQELVERLGLTVEQEQLLAAQGRITTEGILSQEEAIRRRTAALNEANRATARESSEQPFGLSARVEREHMVRMVTGHGSFDVFASQLPGMMQDAAFARSVAIRTPETSGEIWDRVASAQLAATEQERSFAARAARMGYVQTGGGWIPMLAEGGVVRETGVAVVHKGETVVPAQVERGGGFAGGLRVDKIEVHIHGNAGREEVREGVLEGLRIGYDQSRLQARRP